LWEYLPDFPRKVTKANKGQYDVRKVELRLASKITLRSLLVFSCDLNANRLIALPRSRLRITARYNCRASPRPARPTLVPLFWSPFTWIIHSTINLCHTPYTPLCQQLSPGQFIPQPQCLYPQQKSPPPPSNPVERRRKRRKRRTMKVL